MKSGRDLQIVTNNPLVKRCMEDWYAVTYRDVGHREVLIWARDLIYAGYRLYTHPVSGSVKPNETPYKSLVVSRRPESFSADQAELISAAVATYDAFPPRSRVDTRAVLEDFQLIDYTLLASALDFDAAAGLSKQPHQP